MIGFLRVALLEPCAECAPRFLAHRRRAEPRAKRAAQLFGVVGLVLDVGFRRWFWGWGVTGGKGISRTGELWMSESDLDDLPEPLMTCADEAELLDGRPCCCLAKKGYYPESCENAR